MGDYSNDNRHLIENLKNFETFDELRRSDAYSKHASDLDRLFNEPKVYRSPGASPRLTDFLRVVEWNIERGTRFDGIVETLNTHPVLSLADLLMLNELDCGMVRSGNRNVALELSRSIGAHAVYAVEYLEFTKGVGEELNLPGENTAALHGNAVLTRRPFSRPQIIRLPRCENNFESAEKRLGGRVGIMIDVDLGGAALTATSTHLDVVNTPRCRATQMRAFLEAIEARSKGREAVIFGGDLNTHTFARGTRWRTLKSTAKILASDQERLARKLLDPETREPALREFARFGYDLEQFNDRSATSRTIVSRLSDASKLPRFINRWVMRRVPPAGLLLEFRLDWLAARGLRALKAGEVTDSKTGAPSVSPQTFTGLTHNGAPLSDHDPVVVDIEVGVRP